VAISMTLSAASLPIQIIHVKGHIGDRFESSKEIINLERYGCDGHDLEE